MNFKTVLLLIAGMALISENAVAQYKSDLRADQRTNANSHAFAMNDDSDEMLKSRSTAIWWGVGMTSIPIVTSVLLDPAQDNTFITTLTGPLWLVGPSAGLIYAEDYRGALTGSVLRLSGVSFIGAGALILLITQGENAGIGASVILVGAGIYTFSAIWDIFINGPNAVDEYNERVTENSSVSLVPWYDHKSNAAGMSLRVSF